MNPINFIYIIGSSILFLINPIVLCGALRKIHLIINPIKNKSYCILSVCIVYVLIGMIIVVGIQEILYILYYLGDVIDGTRNSRLNKYGYILQHVYFIQYCMLSIFQSFEWVLMRLIIMEQKEKFIAQTLIHFQSKCRIKAFRHKEIKWTIFFTVVFVADTTQNIYASIFWD